MRNFQAVILVQKSRLLCDYYTSYGQVKVCWVFASQCQKKMRFRITSVGKKNENGKYNNKKGTGRCGIFRRSFWCENHGD
jgi:hypothetical protein